MKKLPNISTKTGDNGETSLWSGERVAKNHPAIKCVCELDLLDSSIGIIYSHLKNVEDSNSKTLREIQERLIYLKGEICTHPKDWSKFYKEHSAISEKDVDFINDSCDSLKEMLEKRNYKIKGWVRYGDEGNLSSIVDYTRCLARKSEIEVYNLDDELINSSISTPIKKYINRLSDYFYWLARFLGNS